MGDQRTLYRINPDADDRDVFHAVSTDPGEEPPMVPAEPTDRICTKHGHVLCESESRCDDWAVTFGECELADVVRMA